MDPLDISPSEFDEWLALFNAHLSQIVVMGGSSLNSAPGVPEGWREWIPAADTELSLLLKPQENGLWVLITGTGEPDEIDVNAWKDCILRAASEIGKKHSNFDWFALIGPALSTFESGNQRLSTKTTIAHLTLSEATSRHVEYCQAQQPHLSSSSVFESWPVQVSSSSKGYDWQSAERAASEELVKLCSLLTLALTRTWVVRSSPQVNAQPIPEFSPFANPNIASTIGAEPSDVSIPDWVETAWRALEVNPVLARALGAYYQGMRMQDDSPSHSFVSFVAAIETIGATKVALERCDCCSSCTQRIGYANQFRAGLGTVASVEEQDRLMGAYTLRSKTVHEGATHGNEEFGGWFHFPGLLWLKADQQFLIDLYSLRSVCGRLIQTEFESATRNWQAC